MSETWKQAGEQVGKPPMPLTGVPRDGDERGDAGIATGAGLGKYRILERVRTTRNAILYKARDAMLDRLVTIKQMNPGLLDDPTACGDFKREAQFLARLPRNVSFAVDVYELINNEAGLFLVEEYVDGDLLESLISKRLVDDRDAWRMLRSGSMGLKAMHDRKIIHRCIHPGCLLLARPDSLRISDLGSAAHEGDFSGPIHVVARYAAPELQAGDDYDARADIYAFGMVLYEVAVGRGVLHDYLSDLPEDPVDQAGYWRAWHLNHRKRLPPLCELNPRAASELSDVVGRMIAKNLDRRYSSMDQIIADLVRVASRRREIRQAPPRPALPAPSATPVAPRALPAPQALVRQNPALGGRQPISLTWLLKPDQFTSTHPVEFGPSKPEFRKRLGSGTTPRATQTRVGDSIESRRPLSGMPKQMPSRPVRRQVQTPPVPPAPAEVPPLARERRGLLLPLAAAVLCMIALGAAGSLVWQHTRPDPHLSQVRTKLAEARDAFQTRDLSKAAQLFADAKILAEGTGRRLPEEGEAATMLKLIDGEQALEQNDFSRVEHIINDISSMGAVTPDLSALQSRLWAKKEMLRLARESDADVKSGRLSAAELKMADVERLAREAGYDVSKLRHDLQESVRTIEYEEAMAKANKALKAGNFEAALIACRDARVIKDTSNARQLNQTILDAKRREDLVLRGDKGMLDQAFAEAESSYQAANEIEPSEETEQKARLAGANHLYEQAMDAIREGELLTARRLLENSMWKHETPQAAARLKQFADAFNAARLAQNADRAMSTGGYAEAVRLYEEALPHLPPPADKSVARKLKQARARANGD